MNIKSIAKNIPVPKMLAIAGSAGSLTGIEIIAANWPETTSWATVIVLHTSSKLKQELRSHLESLFKQPVTEIYDQLSIKNGGIYVAPADYHTLVEDKDTFALCAGEKISYARPSIDVFVESACYVFKEKLTTILLSGANKDGSHGCYTAKQLGSTILVQDPDTAEASTMLKSAIVSKGASYILTVPEIQNLLNKIAINNE